MPEEISLEDAKRQIFLGACQIYSAYVKKFNIEHDTWEISDESCGRGNQAGQTH